MNIIRSLFSGYQQISEALPNEYTHLAPLAIQSDWQELVPNYLCESNYRGIP